MDDGMRRLAEARRGARMPTHVAVSFVSPGGLAVKEFADGAALVRVCAGHLDAPDGLLAEARSDAPAAPWASRAARDAAIESVRSAGWVDGDDRELMLRHVAATPYYDC